MATGSLANPSSNLNLSHQQIELLEKIILIGNQLTKSLSKVCDRSRGYKPVVISEFVVTDAKKSIKQWEALKTELALLLL